MLRAAAADREHGGARIVIGADLHRRPLGNRADARHLVALRVQRLGQVLAETRRRADRVADQSELGVAELVAVASRALLLSLGRLLRIDNRSDAEQVDEVLGQLNLAQLTVRRDELGSRLVDIVDPLLPVRFDLELAGARSVHAHAARQDGVLIADLAAG